LFEGVYVAVATPFTGEFEVDYQRLAEHATWLISQGVDGLIPAGTCGEYAVLSDEERAAVVETVLKVARGKVPVVVGVSAPSLRQVVRWAEHARSHGADGVMALPPILYRPTWDETYAYFQALDRVGLPIVVYNNPHDTAVDLTPERLAELESLPNLKAVKEFSGDVRRIVQILEQTSLEVIAGVDDLLVESVAAGATGWIAGMANIVPAQSVEVFRLAREGRLQEAWPLYRKLLPIFRYDSTPRLVQAIKYGMEVIGRPLGQTRPPRLALSPEDRDAMRGALAVL
jgi:4-hydroxy-tetrahydrodipicolinate synthase